MASNGGARRSTTKMVAGSFYVPKENVEKPLGEDAHFICDDAQTIGVADGVGGWSAMGIDAGEYSRALMSNAETSVRDQMENTGTVSPMRVLQDAFCYTEAEGSSTACILTLVDDSVHAVNVGDSGFVIVRGGAVMYRSPVQQREFNFPYQLGKRKGDNPAVAESLTVGVVAGDVIVMGTDGLFDNVNNEELEVLVEEIWFYDGEATPEKLASRIAKYAYDNATSKEADTPFAQAASKAGKLFVGGKFDDITVVVAYIIEEEKKHFD